MQTYHFKPEIEKIKNGQIFTADSGSGYVADGELHLTEHDYHFVYKYADKDKGWYMKNADTGEDVYLDDGASPTAEYETLDILNQAGWEKIMQPEPEKTEDETGVE